MELTGHVILLIYLFIMAVYDIRKKEIHLGLSAAAACCLGAEQAYLIWQGELGVLEAGSGLLIGICVLLASLASGGGIGLGDGVMFLVCGVHLGFWDNGMLLLLSLMMTAVTSGILLAAGRVRGKSVLPFAPFVFVGNGVMLICRLIGWM